MKITEFKSYVRCPNCDVGMKFEHEHRTYEFGEQLGDMKLGSVTVDASKFVYRCPNCKKQFLVEE